MSDCDKVPNVIPPYKYEGTFSARLPDEEKCWLNGVAVHPDTGNIYIIDRENSKLKQFSPSGELLNWLELVDYLHCMILVRPTNDLVITKPEKKLTLVIDTSNGQLKEKMNFQNEKNYYGICQLDQDKFVVSSWAQLCIDIIDNWNGNVLKTIGMSLFGPSISPDLLCVTSAGDIVVSSVGNKVTCIDRNGIKKWSKDLDGIIYGISSTRKGIIYASFKDKSKLMKMEEKETQDNNDFGMVTTDYSFESAIAVCASTSLLLITTENGDVFKYAINS